MIILGLLNFDQRDILAVTFFPLKIDEHLFFLFFLVSSEVFILL